MSSHTNHDPYTSCGTKDINGNTLFKAGTQNYKIQGDKTELPETITYLNQNQDKYHVGQHPLVSLDCSCTTGIHSSSFGAAMMHLNGIYGFGEGGFFK